MTEPRITRAVIPAAGLGTRLLPLTLSQPKEMVACGSAPVMAYILDELRSAGITDILLISRSGKTVLEEFVHSYWPRACILRQPEPRGLGDAVMLARPWVGNESFVVALGDTIISSTHEESPLRRLMARTAAGDHSTVLVRSVPDDLVPRYGIVAPADGVRTGEVFALRDIIEKPTLELAPSRLAIAGRYVFSPTIFAALERTEVDGRELQLTDAMRKLCAAGTLGALELSPGDRRFDIGSLESYYEAFNALRA